MANNSFNNILDAAANGTVEDVKYFIEQQRVDVNARYIGGETALHHAAHGNSDVEVLKYLLSQGANINAKNGRGETPLHYATWGNPNIAVLEYLISQGADVNARDEEGLRPLHFAIGSKAKKRILREAMASPKHSASTSQRKTP